LEFSICVSGSFQITLGSWGVIWDW
jgi:hypothetical protein